MGRRSWVAAVAACVVAPLLPVVLTSTSSAGFAPQARPAFPGDNGLIAYVSDRSGNSEIHTVRGDGSEPTRLTTTDEDELDPSWSPDGTRLVYARSTGEGREPRLFVSDADGTDERQLLDDDVHGLHPAWSPDGRSVAFTRVGPEGGPTSVWVVGADGADLQQLVEQDSQNPAWSPDGRRLAFEARGVEGESEVSRIHVVRADGSGAARLTTAADIPEELEFAPDWSPDGTRVAFHARTTTSTNNTDVYAVGADGDGLRVLADDPFLGELEPAWSPDGGSIAYTRSDANPSLQSYYVWRMRADGSGQQAVTSGGSGADTGASWQPAPETATLTVTPEGAAREVGDAVTVQVRATDALGDPVAGEDLVLRISGRHARIVSMTTDAAGRASYTWDGTRSGTDTVVVCADLDRSGACGPAEPAATASVLWSPRGRADPPRLAFTDESDALYAQRVRRTQDPDVGLRYSGAGGLTHGTDGLTRWDAGATHEGEASRVPGQAPVFVSTRDTAAGEVYRGGDADPVRLTCDPGTEQHPVSAGGLVAYASDADGDWDIYVRVPPEGADPAACGPGWTTLNVTDEPVGTPTYDDLWPTWTWDAFRSGAYATGLVFSRAAEGGLPDLWEAELFFEGPLAFTPPAALTSTPGVSETQPAAMVQTVGTDTRRWVAYTTSEFRSSGSVVLRNLDGPAEDLPLQPALRQAAEAAWSDVVDPAHLAVTSRNDDPYGDIAIAEVRPAQRADGGGLEDVVVSGFQPLPGSTSGVAATHPAWLRAFGEDVDDEATLLFTSRPAELSDVEGDSRLLHADVSDVRHPDGTQRRVLRRAREVDGDGDVTARHDEAGPSYSPDGTRFVYSANDEVAVGDLSVETRVLMVADADGSDAVPLLPPGQRGDLDIDLDPVWSPDGRRVAFVRVARAGPETDPAVPRVFVLDLASGVVRRVGGVPAATSPAPDLSPGWAPDSRHLVVARSEASSRRDLVDGARHWSTRPPDAKPVLRVLDADTPADPGLDLDSCGDGCAVAGRSPAWSPDGRTIAYELDGQLRTVRLDEPCCSGPVVATGPPTTVIGFVRSVDDEGDLVTEPTPARTVVATAQDPAWSPDGSEIAFSGQPEGQPDATGIWAVAPDGSGLRPVTDEPGPESEPDYSDQRPADVSVAVTVAGSPALADAPLVATYVVRNDGPAPATDVALGTTFGAGAALTAPGVPPGCRGDGTGCDLGTLAPGAVRLYVVRLRHGERTLAAATGTVTTSAADPDLTDNVDAALYRVLDPDLRVRVLLDAPVGYVGGARTALVTVRNEGADPVADVAVTATWPGEVLPSVPPALPAPAAPPAPPCLPAGLPCPLGDLAPGAVRRFRVGLEPLSEGTATIAVATTTSTEERRVDDNTDEVDLEVLQPALRVLPGVAPPGKVVLAYGEDMPPGTQVSLAWSWGITIHDGPFRVSPTGTVRVPMLVVRHDLLGTRLITATSAADLFTPVDGELLVVPRTLTPPDFHGRG